MIISRTPFRISFFGGGTDYPTWYREHGGAVLGTTIDKYCYVSVRNLPPFFDHRYRVVYSSIELCKELEEIKHPSVRECLRYAKSTGGIEIHHEADLPARAGIGSSSAFTVSLLHALFALQGRMVSKKDLIQHALEVEQEWIKENVGSQDQVLTAQGGLNLVEFRKNDDIQVTPLPLAPDRSNEFQDHLMLFFTGISRTASTVAGHVIVELAKKADSLKAIRGMVDEALKILTSQTDICDFGKLLHETWKLKRGISSAISNSEIDTLYETARKAGALGGKLLGAGGGGFFLLFAKPKDQPQIRKALGHLLYVPFCFETHGTSILVYEPTQLEKRAA